MFMGRYQVSAPGYDSTLIDLLVSIGLIWSDDRLMARSASPFSSSRRCEAGSGTWRSTTRLIFGAPRWKFGLASMVTDSLAFQEISLNAPEPAECVFSQPLPMSPFTAWAIPTFFSTADVMTVVITL